MQSLFQRRLPHSLKQSAKALDLTVPSSLLD